MLRLVLSQRRVGLREQGGAAPQGQPHQEAAGRHQVSVALSVGEGVAGATGADTPGGGAAGCGGRQSLFTKLVSHLQGERDENEMKMWVHFVMYLSNVDSFFRSSRLVYHSEL